MKLPETGKERTEKFNSACAFVKAVIVRAGRARKDVTTDICHLGENIALTACTSTVLQLKKKLVKQSGNK
jgi:hypothetical protein